MDDITVITTCKNRLSYLKQSLPLMLALRPTEVIVVDYGCPEGTGRWVNENYPDTKVVAVNDDAGFNLSRARNAGVSVARSSWLLFLDADILVDAKWLDWFYKNREVGCFYRVHPDDPDARHGMWGSFLCQKDAFLACNGYDEAITGWGGEDIDLYGRLASLGLKELRMPAILMKSIDNTESEKTAFYEIKDQTQSQKAGFLYIYIKRSLARLIGRELNLETRKGLYAFACQNAKSSTTKSNKEPFRLEFKTVLHNHARVVKCHIEYEIEPLNGS